MAADYSPGNLEVIRTAREIWEKDPGTEKIAYSKLLALVKARQPSWALSEKRFKIILKEANLQQTTEPPFTYIKDTKSSVSRKLALPKGLMLQSTKSRGVGLFTSQNMKQDDVLWVEAPLVQAAPVEFLRLMRNGAKCAYCAKSLRLLPDGRLAPGPDSGIACTYCTANWCSAACKTADIVHVDTFHVNQRTHRPRISCSIWKEYELFCLENNWKAGYLYGRVLLYKLASDEKFNDIMDSMAKVGQDVRQKAVSGVSGGGGVSLETDQLESMWRKGHSILSRAVKPLYNLQYEEFLEGIGMVNINNIDNCLFAIQSHLNHSCSPNTKVQFGHNRADGITVTAKESLVAGQELTTSYVNPDLGVEERQYLLRINWGFICSCARCKTEKAKLEDERVNGKTNEGSVAQPSQPAQPVDKVAAAVSGIDLGSPEVPEKPKSEKKSRSRAKSVHFDKNPVSVEIPAES